MKIKVCGITNLSDGMLASKLGAWALGFIFYEKSPRYVHPDVATEIIKNIKSQFTTPPLFVGVVVNLEEDLIQSLKETTGIDYLQFHGNEDLGLLKQIPGQIKALRPKTLEDLSGLDQWKKHIQFLLVDAAVKGEYGGTGKLSDWNLAKEAKKSGCPLILSGGINLENVKQAWNEVKPYAIDLSSGVVKSPGIKDPEKLKRLFS